MISIIIPTYNEEKTIGDTIQYLQNNNFQSLIQEIIVVDGGSKDNTVEVVKATNAQVYKSPKKGRAAQMNFGATKASEPILYFLHADSIPPASFVEDIKKELDSDKRAGCFMLQFDYKHWFLAANCWFTRFNINFFRFGDQSLFIEKELFEKIKGFDESLIVMEDQEIIKRIEQWTPLAVIKKAVTTSARKYLDNGIYKTQFIFFYIWLLYYLGYSQEKLVRTYRKMMFQDKV
jgi:rSAM/selenodomain-associated transferase 2